MDDDGSCADGTFDARYGYDLDGNRLWARLHDGQSETVVVQIEGLADWTRGSNDAQIHVVAFGRRVATKYLESAVVLAAPTYVPGTKLPLEPGWLLLAVAFAGGLWLLVIGVRDGVPARMAERPAAATVVILVSGLLIAPPPAWAGGGGGGGGGPQVYRRWLFHDHLGTNVLVTNVNGAVIRRRLFEPFGKLLNEQSSTEPHDRLFTGQRYEESTELYDFQQRWYDAETGRFTGVDPVVQSAADPQTLNGFAFVGNNPLNRTDPTGAIYIPNLSRLVANAIAGRFGFRGKGSGIKFGNAVNGAGRGGAADISASSASTVSSSASESAAPAVSGDRGGQVGSLEAGAAERAAAEYAEISEAVGALPSGSGFPGDPPANREANALLGNTRPLGKGEFALPLKTRIALKAIFGFEVDLVTLKRSPAFVRAHLVFIGGWEGHTTRPGTVFTTLSPGQFDASHLGLLEEYFHVLVQWRGGMTRFGYLMNSAAVESAAKGFARNNLGAYRSALGAMQ